MSGQHQPDSATLGTLHFGVNTMPHDMLDLPRLDPGTPAMGQLLQERERPTAGIS
jgi:hypothetical protein